MYLFNFPIEFSTLKNEAFRRHPTHPLSFLVTSTHFSKEVLDMLSKEGDSVDPSSKLSSSVHEKREQQPGWFVSETARFTNG